MFETKKKVLIVATHFPPHMGGVEKYTLDFFSALGQKYQNLDISILSLQTAEAPKYERIGALNVVRIPCFGPDINPFFSPKKVRVALEGINFSSFDLVITQCRYYFFTAYMISVAMQEKIPIVHIEHNAGYMTHKNSFITLAARIYDSLIGKRVLKKATFLIAVSQSVKVFLLKTFGVIRNIEVISGGIQTKDWIMSESLSDTKTFVYCGRLIREKGVSILLEAFEMLQNKYPETSLKILGDGPEMGLLKRQVLEKKLEKRVEFFGVVSSDFIKNLYKIKPVFVNPSFYAEGFQIALLEAVASGLPIITTSVGGAGELLEANRSALFVVSRDKKSLFYAMEEYLLFPQKADTYSSVASRKVKEYFSQEKMVEKFYRYVFS